MEEGEEEDEEEEVEDEEIVPCLPEEDRNWGFCDKTCTAETLPSNLQQLKLDVVEDHECQKLLNVNRSLVHINMELEMCAGKKNYIPHHPVYTRIKKEKMVRTKGWGEMQRLANGINISF